MRRKLFTLAAGESYVENASESYDDLVPLRQPTYLPAPKAVGWPSFPRRTIPIRSGACAVDGETGVPIPEAAVNYRLLKCTYVASGHAGVTDKWPVTAGEDATGRSDSMRLNDDPSSLTYEPVDQNGELQLPSQSKWGLAQLWWPSPFVNSWTHYHARRERDRCEAPGYRPRLLVFHSRVRRHLPDRAGERLLCFSTESIAAAGAVNSPPMRRKLFTLLRRGCRRCCGHSIFSRGSLPIAFG